MYMVLCYKSVHTCVVYRGQSPSEADFNLLDTARKVEMYGIRLHAAKVSNVTLTARDMTQSRRARYRRVQKSCCHNWRCFTAKSCSVAHVFSSDFMHMYLYNYMRNGVLLLILCETLKHESDNFRA